MTYYEWRECLRKMDRPDLATLRAYQFRQFQTAMDVLRSLPSTSAILGVKKCYLPG